MLISEELGKALRGVRARQGSKYNPGRRESEVVVGIQAPLQNTSEGDQKWPCKLIL